MNKHHDKETILQGNNDEAYKAKIASIVHEIVHRQVTINDNKILALRSLFDQMKKRKTIHQMRVDESSNEEENAICVA